MHTVLRIGHDPPMAASLCPPTCLAHRAPGFGNDGCEGWCTCRLTRRSTLGNGSDFTIYIYLLVHRNNGCFFMIVHALSKNEPPPRLNSRAGKDRRCYKTSAKTSVLSEIRRKELHKYSAIVQNGSKNEPLPRLNSRAVKDGAELKK